MVQRFVPQQSVLTDVRLRLFASGQPQSPRVVLQGMGGSGKTQLALECCRYAQETLQFIATLWIDASSPRSVTESYKAIASCILKNLPDNNDDMHAVTAVQNVLRDWKQQWLVVFDNYDDPEAFQVRSINDYIPTGVNGAILFTSRHHDTRRLGNLISVPSMTIDESLELLLHKSSSSAKEKMEASEIASILGCLPLALDQAAAYIESRGLLLGDFIWEYKARKQVILQAIPDQWEYRKMLQGSEIEKALSVFTTWEMSLSLIRGSEKERRAKERFLTLAAFLNNNKLIPERYFRVYCEGMLGGWIF